MESTDNTDEKRSDGDEDHDTGRTENNLSPVRREPTISGYLNKIEQRPLVGGDARRKLWFVLSPESAFLYWYKDSTAVSCCGRVSLARSAYLHNPKQCGTFQIISGVETLTLEAESAEVRDEWLRALQRHRHRLYTTSSAVRLTATGSSSTGTGSSGHMDVSPGDGEIGGVDGLLPISPTSSSSASTPPMALSQSLPARASPLAELLPSSASSSSQPPPQQQQQLSSETPKGRQARAVTAVTKHQKSTDDTGSLSTFYLTLDGQLADNSTATPSQPSTCKSSPSRATQQHAHHFKTDIDIRALERHFRRQQAGRTLSESTLDDLKANGSLFPAELCTAQPSVDALRTALLRANAQLVALRALKSMQSRRDQIDFLLSREAELTRLQMESAKQKQRIRQLDDENQSLVDRVTELEVSVEAFRDSLRTKEELVMRLAEESSADCRGGGIGGGAPPQTAAGSPFQSGQTPPATAHAEEAILVEGACGHATDVAVRRQLAESAVHDVTELQSELHGYRAQNVFLNNEILELHSIVTRLEERERTLHGRLFDVEACYYQLKSRYLFALNHFSNAPADGAPAAMQPDMLQRLTDELQRGVLGTSISNEEEEPEARLLSPDTMAATPAALLLDKTPSNVDSLGFYASLLPESTSSAITATPHAEDVADGAGGRGDLVGEAALYMRHSNQLVRSRNVEQSAHYIEWLQRWDAFLVNALHQSSGATFEPTAELKELVRRGVPQAYRTRVWTRLVDYWVRDKRTEMGNGYYKMLRQSAIASRKAGKVDSATKQIDLDLVRTLPTNRNFVDPNSPAVERLRHVLYAFRLHNKPIGYCQGLNRLVAIGLLYLDEETAFWWLVACVEHLQPPAYYTPTLEGAVADQKVLRDLVQEKLPRTAAHLRALEVDLSLFSLPWFLTVFVDVLPHRVYLPIFDVFLLEGNKVLFRFALALLRLCEPAVLKARTASTVHAALSRARHHVPDFHALAQIAFHDLNPFQQKTIDTKRALYIRQLRDNM